MGEGNVKVCVRVRPLIQRETTSGSNVTYWKSDKNSMTQIDNNKCFIFDRVFGVDEQTCDVFDEIARPIIKAAVKGYNGTIFAYGQTSSGKTFTMLGSESHPGIIPLAMKEVFDVIKNLPSREFLLRVSYMEIYNETICDLLSKDKKKKSLDIHEDVNRTVYVADLREEVITSIKDILEIMSIGEKNRHYGETKMNDHSSRSHSIFRMIIESRERSQRESMDGAIAVSHLNLVDLAGSERTRQTGAEGLRLKEGCNINRSLFILGQVIKKLSENPSGGVYLNYRDSKLTRILQNSLGGNAKTVILCTVTPAALEETLSTLMFASTAKNMKNSAHVNEVIDDEAMLKCCRREIMNLKKELMQKTQMHQAQAQQLAERDQQQRESEERIRSLKHMIINYSVTAAGAADDSAAARPKRRETWCPGLLRSQAKKFRGNSNMTGDLDLASATDVTQGEDTSDLSLLDVNKSLGFVSVRRERGSSAMVMVGDDPEEEESEWLRSISSEDSPLFSKLQAKVSELEEELQDARLKEAEKNGQFMAILDDRDELRQELATLEAKLKEMEAERQRVETGAHDSPLETAGAPSDHLVASNGASGQHFNSTKDENDPNAAPLALQLNVQDYEEQISALKGRVAACEKENSRLRDAAMEAENIAQYLEEISNLQSGLSHLKTENAKLRELVENRSPEGKEVLDSSCEAPNDSPANALLAEENTCLKLEWETMGKEVEKAQAECAEASSRLLDCQFRLSAMEEQNSELNDELHAKNRDLVEANTSLKSLDEELSSLRMKLRENEDGIAQHDEDGPTAVQLLEERLTGLNDQVTEMQIINQDLATELALKELNLQKVEQSAKASAEEISTLQLSSDAAKAELEHLKGLLEQKSEELDQWASSSMDERIQLELQLASLRKGMEQLGEELQIARKSKEQAGDSHPEMEASDAVAQLSSLETQCEMLQSKLREKSSELDTLAGVLEENRSLQTKLESENQDLQDKVVKMSLEYEREICNNKTLVTEIAALQQQVREFDDDNSRLVEESKGYSETNITLQHSVEEAQQQVSLLKDSVEKLTEENYELKMDIQGTTLMSRPAQEPVSQGSRKRAEERRSTRRSSKLIAKMELSFDECDYRLLNPQQAADTCSIIPENLAEVELESLRGKLASLEEENKSLLALLLPAPKKPEEEMSDSVAELLARVPILEEEKCRLEAALDTKTRELGSISDEATTIKKQLKSAEKEIENLQMILDALNEESVNQYKLSSSENERMNTMEEENECLRKKLEALLAHAAESDHVEVSNEADVNLEAKLRTLEEEKANLQAQIEHVQAECEALSNAADDNAGRMRVVESELESARLQNEEMSITLVSVQAKLQEVDHENAQLRDHVNSAGVLDDKLSTAMETILMLNEKLSSIQIEKQELQVRVDSLQTQSDELSTASNITALNSELQLLQEEKEALQSQFEDAVLRCERLSSISDELADLKVRFAMTQDEKESLQLQIDSLAKEQGDRYLKGTQEASMLEEKINVLEHEKRALQILLDSDGKRGEELSAETEMISLKVKLQELQDQNEALRLQFESCDVQCQQLSGRSNEVSDLKSRLHKIVEENVMVQSCGNSDGVKRAQLSASSDEVFLKVQLQELQGEREQMQCQLYSLQLQCEQLSSAPDELRDLKTRLGVLEEEKELLKTQLNSTHSQALNDKSSENADKISALTETLELMELERRELQLQLNSAKAQHAEWADEMSTLKHNFQELQDKKDQLESWSDSLRLQCEQLSATSDELADLKTKLQVIQIENSDLKTRLQMLVEAKEELLQTHLNSSTHSQDLSEKLAKTAAEISALKERLELVEGEKGELQVQLDSAKTQQEQWSSATDELATLKLKLQALQDEKNQLELQFESLGLQCEQLSAASDELADLKTKLQVIQIENAGLKTKLRVLEEEKELLQTKLNSSTHSQELGDELAKTAEEISALKERLELVEGEKADLQVQLDSAKTQQDQWSSATDELATLKLKLQALQDEKEQLELQFDLLRRQCEQLSAASDELADLKILLQVIQNENEILQQEHSHNKEMSAMKDRNRELQALIDSLQTPKDLLSTTSDEIVSLKAALEALQTEREELKSQLDFTKSQYEQLSFASEETSSLRSKLEMAVVESARLQSCLESANTQLEVQSHVTLELEQMRSALSTLEGKRARMQALLGCGDTTDDAREEEEDPFVGKSLLPAEAGRVYSRDSMRDSGIGRSSGDMVELGSNIPLLEDEQLLVCDEGDVGSHDASVVSTLMEERNAESDELRRSLEELKEKFVRVQNERRRSSHKHLNQEEHLQNQLLESIQLCESLLLEKKELEAQLEARVNLVEKLQEDLRTKKVELQDLQELQEFENLEKKTEHEAQLMHEFEQLNKLVQQGVEYNQELEADLKRTLQELRCKEEEMRRLQEEMFQMTEAMSKQQRWENDMPKGSDAQELREHVKTLRKSLEDAETVTKDSTKQAAILRTENLSLKEQMADIQVRLQALTREAEGCRSSLEQEKVRYCSMEMDLQRELRSIYADHTRLSQLLDGKVPKDLQTRYELEKQLQEVKARLQSMMERDQMQTEASRPDKADITAHERATLMQETSELNEKLSLATAERDQLAANLETAVREKVDLQRRALARDDELALEKENIATEKELARQQELCLAEELACRKAELSQSSLASSVEHRDATGALSTVTEQLSDMKERVRCFTLQRDELSARVDTLVAERESLLAEKGLLESALLSQEAGAREEHGRLSREVAVLNEQLGILAEEKAAVQLSLERVIAERDEIQSDLQDNVDSAIQIQAELLELQAKLKASQMQQKDMEKALQEKSTEVMRMQKRLMEAQSSGQAMQIQGELFELQEKMKASEMQHKDMEKALQEKSTKVVWLQKQLTEAQVSEQDLSARMSDLNGRCAKLSADLSSREALVEQLQGSLSQEQRRTLDEEQRHSALVEELRAAHHGSEGLRDEVQVLSRQVVELEQQLALAQEKNNNFIAEAAHHVEELNLMTLQSEYFMKLIDESDMELKEERNRTQELLARVASLESQLEAATAGGLAGPSGSSELQQLKEKLTEVEASLKFNKETMSSSEKAFGETVERLQSELAVEKRQTDVLRQRVAVLESEAPHLSSQLQVAHAEQSVDTSESQQQLETLKEEVQEMKFQSEYFMKLIDESDMELKEERNRTKELLARVASLESQLQAAMSGGRAGPSESGELQRLKEKLTEVEASLKFNKETMGSSEKAFGETVERLQSELAVEKRQTDVLRQRVAMLESEAPRLGSQVARAEQSADTSESQQQLETLKEEVQNLQELLACGNDGKEEAVALRAKMAEMVSRVSELEQRVIRRDSQLCDLKRRLQVLMKPNKPDADGKESADVKYELVKLQLEKYKLESAHEKEVKSLKTTLSVKEQTLRRLKEDLRAARQQADSTFSEPSHSASSGVVTCGGGSGVIQATALIILQNENTRLHNELKHLKLKLTSIKEGTMLVRLKDSATKYKRENEALRENVKLLQSQLDLQKVESSAAAPPSPQLPPAPKTASDAPAGSLRTPTKRAKACIENKAPLSPRKNLMMPQPKKQYFEPGAPIALPSNVQFFDNSRLELSPQKRAPRSTANRDDEDFWKGPSHADQCKQQ